MSLFDKNGTYRQREPVKRMRRRHASFKGAVPGNLGDNTKPSTPESQQHAVDLLKQGGILPPDENATDYPVLTASVKREIIATLLKRKQPKLATWASRNLRTRKRVHAAKWFVLEQAHLGGFPSVFTGKSLDDVVQQAADAGMEDYHNANVQTVDAPNASEAVKMIEGGLGDFVDEAKVKRARKKVGASTRKRRTSAAAPLMVLSEDDWDELQQSDPKVAKAWKGYWFKMTFGIITEESAQEGDYAEQGWEVKKSSPSMSLEELLEGESAINNRSWLEWSSSHPQAGDWITSQEEQDYRTGETTTYDLFIERGDRKPLSKEEMQYISRTLGVRM